LKNGIVINIDPVMLRRTYTSLSSLRDALESSGLSNGIKSSPLPENRRFAVPELSIVLCDRQIHTHLCPPGKCLVLEFAGSTGDSNRYYDYISRGNGVHV